MSGIDVIEDIVKEYEDVEFQYPSTENPQDKVHLNTDDILIQRIEKAHEFSLVGNHMGHRHDIVTLIDKASCLEELIEFACPVSTHSYRYDMRPIVTKGHLEFRFEMPDIDFHPMSCVIGMLLRFVSTAVILPTPKRFTRKGHGKGRTLSLRKKNCFKWLIQDRYLEVYFKAVQCQSQPEENINNNEEDYFEDTEYQNKPDCNIRNLEDELSTTSSKGSLMKSVTSVLSQESSPSRRSFVRMHSLSAGMSSSSLLDPLLSSMQDKLNDSELSCAPPPPERKPSSRSVRMKRSTTVDF